MRRYAVSALAVFLVLFATALHAQKGRSAPQPISTEECLACHSEPSLTRDENGKPVSVHVDEGKFKASIHGMFSCTDCHSEIKSIPHEPVSTRPQCVTCHADAQEKYDRGHHAKAVAAGNRKAASCQDCHGNVHELLPASNPASRVSRQNISITCASCHGSPGVMQSAGLATTPVTAYQDSVHGRAIQEGKLAAAVCTDCHGSHEVLRAGDPASSIFKFNVPATCGKCHTEENKQFIGSAHGVASARGNWNSPVCSDCHGIHGIKRPQDPNSPVSAANQSLVTCASCHESVKLTREFGVRGRRASTYLASYHGMAIEMGSTVAADCASCHTAHNILPSSNPNSSINHANLAATCGQCHPGANEYFIQGKIHLDPADAPTDTGSAVYNFVTRFYIWMIVFTIGAMLLHNIIIFRRKLQLSRIGQPRQIVRMSKRQRIQHLTLLISFLVLVFTGFALKFPTSWLAAALGNSETVRSVLHRIAGVVLIVAGAYHIFYVIFTAEGRKLIKDFLPEWKDVTDFRDTMRYYLGRSDKRPQFKRFNYAEKAEYWALVWGSVIMAITGLMAWFQVGVGTRIPRWTIDVALTIHLYEAILATLAILVWHFYMVIFDPDTYPMNWAWLDGRMNAEHYAHEHALDMETLSATSEEPELEAKADSPADSDPKPNPGAADDKKKPE